MEVPKIFKPYIAPEQNIAEFTVKSVVFGCLFGIIFGSIGYSIYMGIKSYKGELCKYPIIGKKVYDKVYGPGY